MFIRTRRLFLRPAWREDAPAIAAAIGDWEIVKNLGRAPWPYMVADAEAMIARGADPGGASFLIFARTDGYPVLVGGIGFGRRLDPHGDAELGYWIAKAHWGRGYAEEAGRAVLELAFEGMRLPALAAGHFVDNPASGRVLRKLGFEATGEIVPHPCRARGRDVDACEYRLTAARWRSGGANAPLLHKSSASVEAAP